MYRTTICLLAFTCVCTASTGPYVAPRPAPVVVSLPANVEAQAAAITNAVGAKASAAKLGVADWKALNQYGHEIGVPLLARPYGKLTGLYAASLPSRSLVGEISPAFVKDSYGNIKYISPSSIGVVAI